MRPFFCFGLLMILGILVGCDDSTGAAPATSKGSNSAEKAIVDSDKAPQKDAGEAIVGEMPPKEKPATVLLNGDNTKITFVGRKTDGSHEGGFEDLNGTMVVDPDTDQITAVTLAINTESLWSDDEKLTTHLKSPDFFNVREHPKATFQSTEVKVTGDETVILGELTMLGLTNPVAIPATIHVSDGHVSLEGQFDLSRKAFGMTYGGDKIEDSVEVTVAANHEPANKK